ncbi:MAG: hypothetical protein ACOX2F_12665 [bacterium]
MRNLFIVDGSTENILIGESFNGQHLLRLINMEKARLSRHLPAAFQKISQQFNIDPSFEVIVGSGPGPFTGLKSVNSFFLGLLYSKGITKIKVVSSFKIISALTPASKNSTNRLVLIPFNKNEYFSALLDCHHNFLVTGCLIKEPFHEISEIFKKWKNKKVELIAGSECSSALIDSFNFFFEVTQLYENNYLFNYEEIALLLKEQTLDITKEPFILNYILNPAGIDKECNIYTSTTLKEEQMTEEKLTSGLIMEKILKLKEEHAKYDELSDKLAAKKAFTPQDETELNILRKKKLKKKDMIVYYENLLKGTGEQK